VGSFKSHPCTTGESMIVKFNLLVAMGFEKEMTEEEYLDMISNGTESDHVSDWGKVGANEILELYTEAEGNAK